MRTSCIGLTTGAQAEDPVPLAEPIDLAPQGLEAGIVVISNSISLYTAHLLQLAVETESEIDRRLLRPTTGSATYWAEVRVMFYDDIAKDSS